MKKTVKWFKQMYIDEYSEELKGKCECLFYMEIKQKYDGFHKPYTFLVIFLVKKTRAMLTRKFMSVE